ncbi:3-methyl-2-oxobutanoate hydroxymethyltransferase [hydrothermal vent metagenome]|uniref:3-methyl-2-oxobutanoate hydroxymethyltransferase n=1 Tax=hydrothermal vent metagenome TaxID=652676 RepID=A0A3B0QS30_9ZZZZ
MKKITAPMILEMKRSGEKITMLTAYSSAMARLVEEAEIQMILVGDSVGMVEAGYETTLPVTMDEMVYHTRSVRNGSSKSLVVADMPFMSYQASIDDARRNAGRLIKEGRAGAVKIEGGLKASEAIRAISDMDVPIMAHIGLTPQSVHMMGGYKVQGRGKEDAEIIMDDARAVQDAGAFAVVLEAIPAMLARTITQELSIPTIGIGAGPYCDGQVLVLNDMLGLEPDKKQLKFVKQYAGIGKAVKEAAAEFKKEVESGHFPGKEHCY